MYTGTRWEVSRIQRIQDDGTGELASGFPFLSMERFYRVLTKDGKDASNTPKQLCDFELVPGTASTLTDAEAFAAGVRHGLEQLTAHHGGFAGLVIGRTETAAEVQSKIDQMSVLSDESDDSSGSSLSL